MHRSVYPHSKARLQLELVRAEPVTFETHGGTIVCRTLESLEHIDSLELEWSRLFAVSPTATTTLRWSWIREWWRLFHTSARSLAIVTVRRGAELIGVLPLYREVGRHGRVRAYVVSLSATDDDSFYPEYTDILYAPGCAEICGDAIAATAERGDLGDVDEWFLGLARPNGPLATILAPRVNTRFSLTSRTSHAAPYADLTGGFDAYLAQRPATARQQFRRLLRGFHETSGARFEVAATSDEADQMLLDLIDIHQQHWHAAGETGAFATPRRVEFHRSVVRHPATAAVLARVSVGERTVSALYGFVVDCTFEFYQSGTSRADTTVKRPGIVSHLLLMKHLATRGIERYDFLAGATPYKLQLSSGSSELSEITIQRPTPRLLLTRAIRALKLRGANN